MSSGMNALRMTFRQFPDDFAKMAQSAGVVPGFAFALMLADTMLLDDKHVQRTATNYMGAEPVRVLLVSQVESGPDLSVGPARAFRGLGSYTEEVQEPISLDRFLDVTFGGPEGCRVLLDASVECTANSVGRARTLLVPCQPTNSSLSRSNRCAM